MTAGEILTWRTETSPVGGQFLICAQPPWLYQNNDTSVCPLQRLATNATHPFIHTLVSDPDDPLSSPNRTGSALSATVNRQLTTGTTYRFEPPLDSDNPAGWSTYLLNVVGNVTYQLQISSSPAATRDVLINTETGYIQAAPSEPYTANISVIAIDSAGFSVVLQTWGFSSLPPDIATPSNGPGGFDCSRGVQNDGVRYDHSFTCDCTGTGHTGSRCQTPATTLPQLHIGPWQQVAAGANSGFVLARDNRTQWALDATYRIAPVNVSVGRVEGSLVDVPVTFVLRWHDDVSPASGFFIDGNTGEQLIRIPAIPGTFSAALQATAAGASPVTLYSTNFTFAAPDTANPINGPAGKDCASQDQQVDSIEFDHRFTCDWFFLRRCEQQSPQLRGYRGSLRFGFITIEFNPFLWGCGRSDWDCVGHCCSLTLPDLSTAEHAR